MEKNEYHEPCLQGPWDSSLCKSCYGYESQDSDQITRT